MIKLGQCVQQLITTLADNYDKKAPFRFAKLDINNGFWRLEVSDTYAWNFCYVFPKYNKVEKLKISRKWCQNDYKRDGESHHLFSVHRQKHQGM